MKLKSIKKMLLLSSVSVCTMSVLCCCGGEPVFPIQELPPETKETFSPVLDISNTVEQSRTTGEDTQTKPNDILAENRFEVFFDNTTGCFMGFVNAMENDRNDIGYQMFAKTMTSFKDILDCAESYSTYTLQPDSGSVLIWQEYQQNIFTNFGNISAYTANTHSFFADSQAPVTMWLDEVSNRLKDGDDSTIVYISDLNEQNGLLSQSGADIKDILNSHPEKDLLVISYVLQYRGEISSPTFGNEGNNKSQVETKYFEEPVDRQYYALVFGDHEVLTAFNTKTAEGFGDVNIEMTSVMYRDLFYSEDKTLTLDKSGELIESADFISENPPVVKVLGEDGSEFPDEEPEQPEEPEEKADDDDLFGDSGNSDGKKKKSKGTGLANLELCTDYTEFFSESPQGEHFIFRNLIPDQGSTSAEVTIKLENSELYSIDTSRAVAYTYSADSGDGFDGETGNGWKKADGLSGDIWSAEINEDTVTAKLSDYLSDETVSAVAVSVPIVFPYSKQTVSSKVINIDQNFRDWVNSCKVPDIITDENETLRYTKTYGFDSFIDKITGYKSLAEDENKDSEEPVTEQLSADVCRINLIFTADERE